MQELYMSTYYRLWISALILALLLAGCGKPEPLALGTLERDRIVHKATSGEIITALPVAEGSQVAAGTLLVQLDPRRQQAALDNAQAELIKANARFDELRNGARVEDIDAARAELNGAKASLTSAERTYLRALQLREKHVNSQADLDQAEAARDSAAAQVEASREQLLALTNGTREETLAQAQADVNAAKAQHQLAQLTLDELSVRATRAGYLDSLPWNLGERVSAGTPVAILLADAAPYARVYIPEPVRATLNTGDTLWITADGVAQGYSGTLRWVARDPAFSPYYALNKSDRSRLVYLAEIDLANAEQLPTGMPVQVYRNAP
jgi:HlyD family secretion protein